MRATVVGSGVAGLTTAINLQRAGWQIRVLSAAPIEALTSHLAAAVWFPTHAGPPEAVARWGAQTFEVLAGQALEPGSGVAMRESLALYRFAPGRPDWAAAVRDLRPAGPAELPAGYTHGLRFVVPLVQMPVHLPWLVGLFRTAGGTIRVVQITSLDEVLEDGWSELVVNCTGLAARELADDPSVYPVRGQIVRVGNPGLTVSMRAEHHPAGRAYLHPRTGDCILGGTLDEHRWDTDVDPIEAESILARCRQLEPRLVDAEVLEHVVGLRPARPTVRVEESATGPGQARLLHNYGHGGSGITLGWGCAQDIATLAASGL
ncbi:MAG: FAD-dependent oxidoreductase [Geodermatophilaceae bacterium]